MFPRVAALIALLAAPAAAGADGGAPVEGWGDRFLEIRLGDAPPARTADTRADARISRALRDARRALEERRLERTGAPGDLRRYRARELRADDVQRMRAPVRAPGPAPALAERIARDIERAQDRLQLERRVRRLERHVRERDDRRRRSGLPR